RRRRALRFPEKPASLRNRTVVNVLSRYVAVGRTSIQPKRPIVTRHLEIAGTLGGAGVRYGAFPIGHARLVTEFLVVESSINLERDAERGRSNLPVDRIICPGARAFPVTYRHKRKFIVRQMPGLALAVD